MPTTIDSIETPALIIDEAVALANIRAFQDHCDKAGLKLRPHIKTHKSVRMARAQLAAGAVGITCQKIGEAEVMADGGIDDILITFNILGQAKIRRLRALAERVSRLSVTVDNETVVEGLCAGFADAPASLGVLVECDTGAGRCGVQIPEQAARLGMQVAQSPGLAFHGLMTYPAVAGQADVVAFMKDAKARLQTAGIACPEVSSGGSPDMWQAETAGVITEYRIGTYIYNDRSLVARGSCKWSDCAAHVLATVVSTPAPGRAVIDAGSKMLTSDLLGLDGHGHVVEYPEARIVALSEEHGTLALPEGTNLQVGERIRIVPNHVCVVSNMVNRAWLKEECGIWSTLSIDARGRVT